MKQMIVMNSGERSRDETCWNTVLIGEEETAWDDRKSTASTVEEHTVVEDKESIGCQKGTASTVKEDTALAWSEGSVSAEISPSTLSILDESTTQSLALGWG